MHTLLMHDTLKGLHDDHAYCTTVAQAKAAVARLRAVNPREKAVDTLQQRIAEAEESESSSCSCPSCIQAAFRKQLCGSDTPVSAAVAAAAVAALPCSMREEVMADAAAVAAQSSPHYAALLKLQGRDAAQEQAAAAKAAKKALKAAAKAATAAAAGTAANADEAAATAAAAAATERAAYKHQQGAQGGDWQQMAWLRDSLVQMQPGPEKNLKFAMHGLDPVQMVSHSVFRSELIQLSLFVAYWQHVQCLQRFQFVYTSAVVQ
jgi:hypothetical protein